MMELIKEKVKLSRRSLLKATAAIGASAMVYGCSKSADGDTYIIKDPVEPGGVKPGLKPDKIVQGTGNHNCGARCLVTAHVNNGRIVRIVSDEATETANGNVQKPDSINSTHSKACARCRAYKHRLYHPGRLKYPLKQTKKRGDLTGFIRMSWDEALKEITQKHYETQKEFGPESIYSVYACGSYTAMQGGSYSGLWATAGSQPASLRLTGGTAPYYNNYSFHQKGFFAGNHTGFSGGGATSNDIAGVVDKVILWGSNILSTVNSNAHSTLRTLHEVRKRGGEIIFIGPEFADQGVTTATKWIQSKPYTDNATILAILHEMLINTFEADGSLKSTPWLDVEYLDAAVYGFFDSPEYWVNKTTGAILFADPSDTKYTKVNAVPAGRSLSAYILGNDDRLTKAQYAVGNTNIAQEFSTVNTFRNADTCSYTAQPSTKYKRKADYLIPKTPEWAEKISGVPAATIRELAKMYARVDGDHIIYSEWSGGLQKQAEGVINYFGLETLALVTKTYGRTGETISRGIGARKGKTAESLPNAPIVRDGLTAYTSPAMPISSCAMWHNGVKIAFGDILNDNGYTAQYIPDFDQANITAGKVYHDDGGTKALLKWKRDTNGKVLVDANGYYVYETDTGGKPIYSGYRFILNTGGNILINQHMNSNDSKDMFERIPVNSGKAEDLCVVSFDNFLSPTPRWSDYVLPAATNWEMDNRQSISNGNTVITPATSTPPGESLSTWNFTVKYLKAYESADPSKQGIASIFTGADATGETPIEGDQYLDKFKREYDKAGLKDNASSRFYGKTFEEALTHQFQPSEVGDDTLTLKANITKNAIRTKIDTYLALDDATRKTTPFCPNITTRGQTSYGNQYPKDVSNSPGQSGRFHVYTEIMVWQYENRFKAWHGYLPANERGQSNIDMEGDPIVLPIAMYFAYEDYFMEAYGGTDKLPAKPFLLTTSHDRHRAHSSQAEVPYLRELTHRTINGSMYSGNDWGTYALSDISSTGQIPRLNKAIAEKNRKRASWSELWMNSKDAQELGVADGDLLQVENVIGAVRVIARLTNRCVSGMVGLHQGCWYDPDPTDGVDDGGNCNTLMASKPSRVDHGNGQQSAMVSIKKVQW